MDGLWDGLDRRTPDASCQGRGLGRLARAQLLGFVQDFLSFFVSLLNRQELADAWKMFEYSPRVGFSLSR